MTRRILTLALGAALLVGGGPLTALPATADPAPTPTPTPTTVVLSADPAVVAPGASSVLSAEVTATGTGTPTGTVTIRRADAATGVDLDLAEDGTATGTSVTVSTTVTAPATPSDVAYVATYDPDPASAWAGEHDELTLQVRRPVVLGVDVPTELAGAEDQVSVEVAATDPTASDAPVEGTAEITVGSLAPATLELDGAPARHSVDYADLVPGQVAVTVAFTPDEPGVYAVPATAQKSFSVGRRPTVTLESAADATDPVADEPHPLVATVDTAGQGVPAGAVLISRSGDTGPATRVELDDGDAVVGADSVAVSTAVTPPVAGTVTYTATFDPASGSPLVSRSDSLVLDVAARDYDAAFAFDPVRPVRGSSANKVSVTLTDDDDRPVPAGGTTTLKVGTTPVALTWANNVGTGTFDPAETGVVGVDLDVTPTDGAYAPRTFDTTTVDVLQGTTTTFTPPTAGPRVEDRQTFSVQVSTTDRTPTGWAEIVPVGQTTAVGSTLLSAGTATGAHAVTVDVLVDIAGLTPRDYFARYVPDADSQPYLAGSRSAGTSTVTPVRREVVLTLDVAADLPTAGVKTSVTVTAKDRHLGRAVQMGSYRLTIGTTPVTLTWVDGVGTGDWTPGAAGDLEVDLAFRPSGASYDEAHDAPTDLDAIHVVDDTRTQLAVTDPTPLVGDPTTISATVRNHTGTTTPTGRVAFTVNGGTAVYAPLLRSADGVAVATLPVLKPGSTQELAYAASYEPAETPAQLHTTSATDEDTTIRPRQRTLKVVVGQPDGVRDLATTDPATVTLTVTDLDDPTREIDVPTATFSDNGTSLTGTVSWSGTATKRIATVDYRPTSVGSHTIAAEVIPSSTAVYHSPATGQAVLVVKQQQSPTAAVPTGPLLAGASAVPVTVTGAYDADGLQVVAKPQPGPISTCTVAGVTPTITVDLVRGPTCTLSITADGDAEHFAKTFDLSFAVTPRTVVIDATVTPTTTKKYGTVVKVTATAAEEAAPGTPLAGTGEVRIYSGTRATKVLVDTHPYTYAAGEVVISDLDDRLDADVYFAEVTYVPPVGPPDLTGVLATSTKDVAFTITQTEQEVAFTDPEAVLFAGEVWTAAAYNATEPDDTDDVRITIDEAVSVTADGDPTCEVHGADVRFLAPGDCKVDAEAPASKNYLRATATTTVEIDPRPLTVTMTAIDASTPATPGVLRYGDLLRVRVVLTDQRDSASTVSVDGPGTIAITPPTGPTVSTSVTFDDGEAEIGFDEQMLGTHTVVVTAAPDPVGGISWFDEVAATDPVLPGRTFKVEPGLQQITWRGDAVPPAPPTVVSSYVDEPLDPRVTGGASNEPVRLAPVDKTVCDVVSGRIVVASTASTCQVEATQAGGSFYQDAPARTLSVTPLARPLEAAITTSAKPTYGSPITITVTATDTRYAAGEPNAGTPGTATDPIARLAGTGTLTVLLDGEPVDEFDLDYRRGVAVVDEFEPEEAAPYTLQATYAPSRGHAYVVPVTITDVVMEVAVAKQVIVSAARPVDPNVGTSWDPTPLAKGDSTQPVTLTIATPGVCAKVRDPDAVVPVPDTELLTIVFTKVSADCTVTYRQAGDARYGPAEPVEVTIRVERRKVTVTPTGPDADLDFEDQARIDLDVAALRAPKGRVDGHLALAIEKDGVLLTDPEGVAVPGEAGSYTQSFASKTLTAGDYDLTFTFTPDDLTNWEPKSATVAFHVDPAHQTVEPVGSPPTTNYVTKTWTPEFEVPSSGGTVTLSTGDVDDVTWFDEYDDIPAADPDDPDALRVPDTTCATQDDVPDPGHVADTVRFRAAGPCQLVARLPEIAGKYYASDPVIIDLQVSRIPTDVLMVVPKEKDPATDDPSGPRWPTVDQEIEISAVAYADGRFAEGSGTFELARRATPTSPWLPASGLTADAEEWFGGGNFASFLGQLAGEYRVSADFAPSDPVTFARDEDATPARFEIEEARQVLTLEEQVPESGFVGNDFANTVLSQGASGSEVTLQVDPASATYCTAQGLVLTFVRSGGSCSFAYVQAGIPDRYREGRSAYTVEVLRTGTVLTVDAPPDLTVGVPATVTVRATAGSSTVPVPGRGTIKLMAPTGSTVLETSGLIDWVGGVGTFTFVPEVAGEDLRIGASFVPTDAVTFTDTDSPFATRTIATGTPVITPAASQGSVGWVGDSWTPGATSSNHEPVLLTVTGDRSACVPAAPKVSFDAAGECTVTLEVAAVDDAPYGLPTWHAAEPVVRHIVVQRHPVEVIVTEPAGPHLYASDIVLAAQVVGHPRNDRSAIAAVSGDLTFFVDGARAQHLVDGVPTDLPPVPITGNGRTTQTIQVLRAGTGAESAAVDTRLITATFEPDATDRTKWLPETTPGLPYLFTRKTEDFVGDQGWPSDGLRVGQQWTPKVATKSGSRPVVVTAGPPSICTADGTTVTVVGSSATGGTCQVSYDVPGNQEYAPITDAAADSFSTSLRDVTVEVSSTRNPINQPLAVRARVTAAAVPRAATPNTTAVATAHPGGSVTFTVSGTSVSQTVAVDADGWASFTGYTPTTAAPLTVKATFEPTPLSATAPSGAFQDGSWASTDPEIARVETQTTVQAVTPGSISARVRRLDVPASDLTGPVTFSWAPVSEPGQVHELETKLLDATGLATTTVTPPADRDVLITASYGGDRDHEKGSVVYHRALPTLRMTPDRPLTGWQTEPVRITYDCTWPSRAVEGTCPSPTVLTADQVDRTVSVTITSTDGGTATQRLTGINIDRTAPSVELTGVSAGQRFLGDLPDIGCRTSDQTSGSSCRVRLSPSIGPEDIYAGPVTATAVATDAAGNTRSTKIDFEMLQAWVAGAPDVRGGFQVKRRSTVKLVARTEDAQPQLMLPNAKGRLTPGPVFRAIRIRDGVVTWSVALRVPAKVAVGRSWTIGYRLASAPGKTIRLRLDVVRTPGRQQR